MSFDTPAPAVSGRIVDNQPILDAQARKLGEGTKFLVSKNMPPRAASHLLDVFLDSPSDHHIAVCLIPSQMIMQKAKGG